jgi:hypothetical protein
MAFFSPAGTRRMLSLLRRVVAAFEAQGMPVFIIELAYDDAPPRLAGLSGATLHVVRSHSVMFHKENLWNLLAARVPEAYKKLLFMDAHILFAEPYWYASVSRMLDVHPVIQPFQTAGHLDAADSQAYLHHPSLFAALSARGRDRLFAASAVAWPAAGFAVAVRREWLAAVGGFMDMAVMGGGDLMLSAALWGLPVEDAIAWTHQPYCHSAMHNFTRRVRAASEARHAGPAADGGLGSTVATASRTAAAPSHEASHTPAISEVFAAVGIPGAAGGDSSPQAPALLPATVLLNNSGSLSSMCAGSGTASMCGTFQWRHGASISDDALVGDVAWAPLHLQHLYHGSLVRRQYGTRHDQTRFLVDSDFWRNDDGVIEFVEAERWNAVTRAYFVGRNEDGDE